MATTYLFHGGKKVGNLADCTASLLAVTDVYPSNKRVDERFNGGHMIATGQFAPQYYNSQMGQLVALNSPGGVAVTDPTLQSFPDPLALFRVGPKHEVKTLFWQVDVPKDAVGGPLPDATGYTFAIVARRTNATTGATVSAVTLTPTSTALSMAVDGSGRVALDLAGGGFYVSATEALELSMTVTVGGTATKLIQDLRTIVTFRADVIEYTGHGIPVLP